MRGITILNAAWLILGGLSATLAENGGNALVFKIKPPVERKAAFEKTASADKTIADLTQKDSYFYDQSGKIDPFRPLFVTEEQPTPKTHKNESNLPLTPLQRTDLSRLKLKGIIISPGGNKALVEDPTGRGYIISKRTYVGSGSVTQILEDRVIVEGEVKDFPSGGTKLQTKELRFIVKE